MEESCSNPDNSSEIKLRSLHLRNSTISAPKLLLSTPTPSYRYSNIIQTNVCWMPLGTAGGLLLYSQKDQFFYLFK